MGFSSVPGKTYRIYVKTGTTTDFVVLHDDFIATETFTTFSDEGGGPNNIPHPSQETDKRIYKIVIKQ